LRGVVMPARDIVTATFGYVNDFEGEDKTRASPNVTHLTIGDARPPHPWARMGDAQSSFTFQNFGNVVYICGQLRLTRSPLRGPHVNSYQLFCMRESDRFGHSSTVLPRERQGLDSVTKPNP